MSQEIYHFEPAGRVSAGHSLKEKVTAVYTLAGFVEKRYRNAADGSPEPYWAYVERGGKETGIESSESAVAVEAQLTGEPVVKATAESIGAIRRIFFGLHQQDGQWVKREAVLEVVASRFPTFTVIDSISYYQGQPEPTLIIEIAAPGGPPLEPLARDLANAFDQDAVGIETGGQYIRVFGKKKRDSARLQLIESV